MKTRKRPPAHKLWRRGHDGLKKLQNLVDRMIVAGEAETEDTDARRLAVALAETKVKLNKELRENAAFELRYRKETLEMEDIELAHRNQSSVLLRIRAEIEAQLQTLLQLDDLRAAVGPATVLRPPTEVPTATDNGQQSITESSEEGPPALGDGSTTDTDEAPSDEDVGPDKETEE